MQWILAYTLALVAHTASSLATSPRSADVSTIVRPKVLPSPHGYGKPPHVSPPRDRFCFVVPKGDGRDDADGILETIHRCNNGGTVVFDGNYTIGSPLDLTFLKHIDIALLGTINFDTDLPYWEGHWYEFTYQEGRTWWKWGGEDVNIFGGGTINGNGQPWWDANVGNSSLLRPYLIVFDGLHRSTISGINMINSPSWFNLIANSSEVIVSNLNLTTWQSGAATPHNTDGWDIYRSEYIVLQDSVISNNDDCVSLKPNSTNIILQNLHCNGSHGISIGSLGQYIGEVDIVENVLAYNITMANGENGARIKTWPGVAPGTNSSAADGGGSGYIKNVTYDTFHIQNVDAVIDISQCYGPNPTTCSEYPSPMTMSDVTFKNFSGVTSKAGDPIVGTLTCSFNTSCINVQVDDMQITTLDGKPAEWTCQNIDESLLEINCIPGTDS